MADLLIPPALRDGHRRGLERYLATGEVGSSASGSRSPPSGPTGASFRWSSPSAASRWTGPAVFTGYVRDVSESKRAEGQLRQSRGIVESSRDAIVGRTLDGLVDELERCRRASVRLQRRTKSSAAPSRRSPRRNDAARLTRSTTQLGRGEMVPQFETVRVRKDGKRDRGRIDDLPSEGCVGPGRRSLLDLTRCHAAQACRGRASRERGQVPRPVRERHRPDRHRRSGVALHGRERGLPENARLHARGVDRPPLLELVPPEWHERT